MKKLLIRWSPTITILLLILSGIGFYLGSGIALKLSLSDLLPKDHPAVVKFDKLTEVVGGVGYFTIVLESPDGESHLKVAPTLREELEKSSLVRSVFFKREQRFFIDRMLYYGDLDELRDFEKGVKRHILLARQSIFDLGLFNAEEEKDKKASDFEEDLKKRAKSSADVSPYLISKDKKHLLVMVKPSFDSTDLGKTRELIALSTKVLAEKLPKGVTYEFAERYYSKVVDVETIQSDILVLGTLSILFIAGIIFLYFRSFRALLIVFIPVFLGMGITVGVARLAIGHINIITGFLMGIVSGLGVDYGIHLYLRLKMELERPSSEDPDPSWRTLESSGHSVFVGAIAAAAAFFLLCFSSFRAFSEFGFICGIGITAVLVSLLTSFSALAKFLKLEKAGATPPKPLFKLPAFPVLSIPKGLTIGLGATIILFALALGVRFEYDFGKMLQHSKKMEELINLVDTIYERSVSPSALSAPTRTEALAVEKMIKQKYMPSPVSEMLSGASIVPEDQEEKQKILERIGERIAPLKDRWIEKYLGIPAATVRLWVKAKPFTFADLPPHLQDAFRGTKKEGFLLYLYPSEKQNDVVSVHRYASMVKDIEQNFPNLLTGSDTVIFSDILDLINRDGSMILLVILVTVGLFIWVNVRKWTDTLLSYLPLLVSLPVGMGLMAIFGVKFNIFNITIIPTFVAMGIDVPIHMVHRMRETGSGYKAARDLATSINLALMTAGVGFGVLVFARSGVLKSLGWIALLGTLAIWWVGLFVLPAFLEKYYASGVAEKTEGENVPSENLSV